MLTRTALAALLVTVELGVATSMADPNSAAILSCRDVNDLAKAQHLDAFDFSMAASATEMTFRTADGERAGEGKPTFLQDWNENRMIGEVAVVLLSCQRHPADMVEQRARSVFNEYVVLQSQ